MLVKRFECWSMFYAHKKYSITIGFLFFHSNKNVLISFYFSFGNSMDLIGCSINFIIVIDSAANSPCL